MLCWGHRFAAMLEDLEASRGDLGIDSYGLTVTTLEEVFLAVSAAAAGAKTGAALPLDGTGPHVTLDMQTPENGKAAATTPADVSPEQQQALNKVRYCAVCAVKCTSACCAGHALLAHRHAGPIRL